MAARIHPPIYFAAGLTAMLALHTWLPGARVIVGPWRWLCIVPLAMAALTAFGAGAMFHSARTTVRPFEEPAGLVVRGPYRITRNPMYLSLVLTLVACAIYLGSATPWLVPPLVMLCIDRLVIPWEEATLSRIFGDSYASYCRRVRRWI